MDLIHELNSNLLIKKTPIRTVEDVKRSYSDIVNSQPAHSSSLSNSQPSAQSNNKENIKNLQNTNALNRLSHHLGKASPMNSQLASSSNNNSNNGAYFSSQKVNSYGSKILSNISNNNSSNLMLSDRKRRQNTLSYKNLDENMYDNKPSQSSLL